MPSAKLAAALVLFALSLSACGISSKPEAGTPKAIANGHKGLDDARAKHTACLQQAHIPFHDEYRTIAGKVPAELPGGHGAGGPDGELRGDPGCRPGPADPG